MADVTRRRLGQVLVGVTVLAVVLSAGDAPSWLRAPVVLVAATALPGFPLVARLRVDLPTLLSFSVCTSLALEAGAAMLMVEARFWHPQVLGLAIAALGVGLTLPLLREPTYGPAEEPTGRPASASRRAGRTVPLREPGTAAAQVDLIGWALPALALVLWVGALLTTHVDALSSFGLIPELPWSWWSALALLLGGATRLTQRPQVPHRQLLAHLGVLLLILYATAPGLESVPRYTYTYKHIAITQYIELYGSVDPAIDIYHRWPGFFSLSAWFSQIAGLPNPQSYAAWAELYFAVLDALLVWSVAQGVTRSARLAWSAVLLFSAANWIGQNYYSPQAFALVLMLGVLLVCVAGLRSDPGPLGRWLERLVVRVLRIKATPVEHPVPSEVGSRTGLIALLLLFDAVLAASHQLTPYVLLLQVGALSVLGFLRPWWTSVGAGLVTVGYLIPNYSFVVNKFGLFSAADPLANATESTADGVPNAAEHLISLTAAGMFAFAFLGALLGLVRRARRGHVRDALFVAVLAYVPPATLVAQSYGGEARMRVFLYCLPWCATAIAWIWSPDGLRLRTPLTVAVPGVVLAGVTGAFCLLFFGREDVNLVTPDEVGAAAYLFAPSTAPPGAVVMLVAPSFPARFGPLYFRQALSDLPVLSNEGFGSRHLVFPSQADASAAADIIEAKGGSSSFLVFSQGQYAYARDYALYPEHGLAAFEGTVASSPRFRLVYDRPTARVYAVVPRTP